MMEEILALRNELAQLLGFENYAFKSLATKMAENPQQVLDFLTDLAKRARPQGEKELAQLRAFAKAEFGVDELQPWDIAYYSEKQKQHLYSISDEQLSPYFCVTNWRNCWALKTTPLNPLPLKWQKIRSRCLIS